MHGYDLSDDNDFEPLKTFVTGYDAAPSNDAVHECLISARKSTKDKFAAMWEVLQDASSCISLFVQWDVSYILKEDNHNARCFTMFARYFEEG